MLEETLESPVLSMPPSRSTLRPHRCMSNHLLLLSLVRAGMVTGTMTGVVIGSVGRGRKTPGGNGNGMPHETIAAGLEMIGATTINAASSEATGIRVDRDVTAPIP